jgi:A-macroglobulin receptor binding domain
LIEKQKFLFFVFFQRVETKDADSVVVMYFDNLSRNEKCPTVDAFRTHKVAHTKPAPVVVYDYYDNCEFEFWSCVSVLIS